MLHIYVGAVVCGFRCLLFGKFLGTSSSVAYYFDLLEGVPSFMGGDFGVDMG